MKKLEKNWKRWRNDRREVEREEDKQVGKIIWGEDIAVSLEEKP